eukprot:4922704-Amphidinium_carterae.5
MVSAMHARVIVHKLECYGEFSLLTPFGRRMQKVFGHRSWLPQEDGSFKPVNASDLPTSQLGQPGILPWKLHEDRARSELFPRLMSKPRSSPGPGRTEPQPR